MEKITKNGKTQIMRTETFTTTIREKNDLCIKNTRT